MKPASQRWGNWAGILPPCLFLLLIIPAGAAAQTTLRLDGQVFDFQGNPFPNVTVEIKSTETGEAFTTKTHKDGKFIELGLRGGIYDLTFKYGKNQTWSMKYQVSYDKENKVIVNFKELAAESVASHAEEIKKQQEEEKKFAGMKAHFENGLAALNQARALQTEMAGAPADQRGGLQAKIIAASQTAVNELQLAEQSVSPKEIANHATILGNLSAAYEAAGRTEDAVTALEKAVQLKPQAPLYVALATDLAKTGKITEASDACDKAAGIDSTSAGMCWRNLGIVLRNANKMKEAVEPLKKATQADPNNPDGWYLLGASLLAAMDYKQEGEKIIYIVQPGTAEAYRKYLQLAPNGPYANEAKEALASLAALNQGEETVISRKKKKN